MVAHECGSLLGWGVFVNAFVNAFVNVFVNVFVNAFVNAFVDEFVNVFVNVFAARSALWRGENHSDCHRYF